MSTIKGVWLAKVFNIEVDDRSVEVSPGNTVMDAANKLGIVVPHFCYHKKLSIAANCRMCLVQVEKAPKPLPACATPVSEGMKVWTKSEIATKAQNGVMEFLLINHPLDCPICDQGGECQLQDLAVGYGSASSRYSENKRVVAAKDLGPLVSAEEMSRCIHCTRCVRFGQEIAGVMELGMAGRGEHSQIISSVGSTVDSELSGNMIDVCPVGALTSKPFRYAARSWELTRLKSIGPHDSMGSNITVQVKHEKVVRVLPRTNEAINECWLSDRDRFSYEALNSDSRLSVPLLKKDGVWVESDWKTVLEIITSKFKHIIREFGGNSICFFGTPQATLEELYLQHKLCEGLGSESVDFRLQREDFDIETSGIPWLGMRINQIEELDRVLIIGSNIRKEQPLLSAKFRRLSKLGGEICLVNPIDEDFLAPVLEKVIVRPSDMFKTLAMVHNSVMLSQGKVAHDEFQKLGRSKKSDIIAGSLLSGQRQAIFLGNLAEYHSHRSALLSVADMLSREIGATLGFLGGGANSVGGYAVRSAFPAGTLNTSQILGNKYAGCLMMHAEADLDFGNTPAALALLESAKFVVSMGAFDHDAARGYSDVILPIAPFSETGGTFINMEGYSQTFTGVVKPLGETRPAWKVLRVLGTLLGLQGFNFNSIDEVSREVSNSIGDIEQHLNNRAESRHYAIPNSDDSLFERIGEVPIYRSDPIVRRSEPLQKTKDGTVGCIGLNACEIKSLGLTDGDELAVRQGENEILLPIETDDAVPPKTVRLPGGVLETSALGPLSGRVRLLKNRKQSVGVR